MPSVKSKFPPLTHFIKVSGSFTQVSPAGRWRLFVTASSLVPKNSIMRHKMAEKLSTSLHTHTHTHTHTHQCSNKIYIRWVKTCVYVPTTKSNSFKTEALLFFFLLYIHQQSHSFLLLVEFRSHIFVFKSTEQQLNSKSCSFPLNPDSKRKGRKKNPNPLTLHDPRVRTRLCW